MTILNRILKRNLNKILAEQLNPSSTGLQPANNQFAWYDASETSLGSVATWQDQSGNGRNATQSSNSLKPVNTASEVNGKNALKFDGNDDFLNLPGAFNSFPAAPHAVFVVAKKDSATGVGATLFNIANNTNLFRNSMALTDDGVNYRNAPSGSDVNIKSYVDTVSSYVIGFGTYNGSNSSSASANNGITRSAPGADVTGVFNRKIGNRGNSLYLNGGIAEMIFYNRQLTDEEIAQTYAYLSAKYAITLAPTVSEPHVWSDASLKTSTNIVHVSNSVSLLANQGTGAFDWTQGTAADQPTTNTRTLNGLNTLDFDGVSDFMSFDDSGALASALNSANALSIYIVVSRDAITVDADYHGIWSNSSKAFRVGERDISGDSRSFRISSDGTTDSESLFTTDTTTGAELLTAIYDGSQTILRSSKDVSDITGTYSGGIFSATAINTLFRNNVTSLSFVDGIFGELRVYTEAHNASQREAIENELKFKWGL